MSNVAVPSFVPSKIGADILSESFMFGVYVEISTLFGISNVSDDIVVNFANRDVVSLKGIDKNGVTHYSEYTL